MVGRPLRLPLRCACQPFLSDVWCTFGDGGTSATSRIRSQRTKRFNGGTSMDLVTDPFSTGVGASEPGARSRVRLAGRRVTGRRCACRLCWFRSAAIWPSDLRGTCSRPCWPRLSCSTGPGISARSRASTTPGARASPGGRARDCLGPGRGCDPRLDDRDGDRQAMKIRLRCNFLDRLRSAGRPGAARGSGDSSCGRDGTCRHSGWAGLRRRRSRLRRDLRLRRKRGHAAGHDRGRRVGKPPLDRPRRSARAGDHQRRRRAGGTEGISARDASTFSWRCRHLLGATTRWSGGVSSARARGTAARQRSH